MVVVLGLIAAGCCGRTKKSRPHDPADAGPTASASADRPHPPKKRKKTGKTKKLPRPTAVKADPKLQGDDCGSVVVDGVEVPLDCVVEHPDPLGIEGTDVVPRAALDRDPEKAGGLPLPEAVDHREDGSEGPVRQQGRAGSCTANAMAAAIDHALMRRDGEPQAVSVLHIWARYHLPKAGHADKNIGRTLASERDFPYDQRLACMWASSKNCKACKIDKQPVPCKQPVDQALVAAADSKPYARVLHVTRLDAPTPLQMRQILARGQDVWMGMKINRDAFKAANEGDHVVGDFDSSVPVSGHSMLVAGYRTQPDGTYFLLHNSWGTRWGDGGYAWIHERQLGSVTMVRVVEAVRHGEPLPPGLADPTPPAPACPQGQAPDAASQGCAPRCPDGSPPFAGSCPGEGCDRGEVAVGGRCVAAAPTHEGLAKTSNVRFECRPGGCVYTLPRGAFGCDHDSCTFACAAPAFVLAHGGQGVFCSE